MSDLSKDEDFLDIKLSQLCERLKVTHVIKVEEYKTNNYGIVDKLNIKVYNRQTKHKGTFTIQNEHDATPNKKQREIVVEGIKRKELEKDSVVLLAFENTMSQEFSFGIVVMEVSKILYKIARFRLSEFMENEMVLEKIIEIAEEIRKEGREGKMVGTLFIIGNEGELNPYIKPLILNPFYGYPDDLKDIINKDLNETIKEYAQLDGAFIINNKGIVLSAGTYVDINTDNIKRYSGWGTKHTTAAAITQETKSIAVIVSESGGKIKLFKEGKLILKF